MDARDLHKIAQEVKANPTPHDPSKCRRHPCVPIGLEFQQLLDDDQKLQRAKETVKTLPVSYKRKGCRRQGTRWEMIPNKLMCAVFVKVADDYPLEMCGGKFTLDFFKSVVLHGWLKIHLDIEKLPFYLFYPQMAAYSLEELHNLLFQIHPHPDFPATRAAKIKAEPSSEK